MKLRFHLGRYNDRLIALSGELLKLGEQVCGDNRIFDRVVVGGRLALLGGIGHDGCDDLVTLFGMGGQIGIDHRIDLSNQLTANLLALFFLSLLLLAAPVVRIILRGRDAEVLELEVALSVCKAGTKGL